MPRKQMNYRQASSGSGRGISAGQWNGFLQMHRDYYNGGASNGPLPPILSQSVIAQAVLQEDMDAIGPYQPVRIVKTINFVNILDGPPSYVVEPVDATDENGDPTERHGNYGFTLGEGCTPDGGGRIVTSGIALVQLDAGDLYYDKTDAVKGGDFDSSYYMVPDSTLSGDTELVVPAGHFKIISWYDSEDVKQFNADDKVYIAIDMEDSPDAFRVKTDDNIQGAGTPDDSTGVDCHSTTGYVYYNVSRSAAPEGDVELVREEDKYEITVYSVLGDTIPSGDHLVTYSKEYNRFVVLYTQSSFQVELEQVGGEQGTSEAPASWTYNVRMWGGDGSILKADAEIVEEPNHYVRPNAGQLKKATYGTATYNSDGDLVIIDCNETFIFTTC